ncbi:MAG TPA: efflux RND transporter periplasmic adaptor subunit [Lysobacter sp.]|nr:efflux RND transporter periplasmic adaptor subunit [Lysobacter sp.]
MAKHDPHRPTRTPSKSVPSTRKRMIWMLLITGLLFGLFFGVKWFLGMMSGQYFDTMQPPPVTVTTSVARGEKWNDSLEAVGTLVAVNGTQVTTESPGVVSAIKFESGQPVRAGEVLVQLNASTELATLKSLEATARLAVVQRDRYREMAAKQLVSREDADQRAADADTAQAQVDAQRALVDRKTIRAPFSGMLGIRKINLGQFLDPGDAIVSLQSIDPIYVDFSLPEQNLPRVAEGTGVRATVDSLPGETFEGNVTATEAEVSTNTRNFGLRATLRNPGNKLRPGGFAQVSVNLGGNRNVVVVPQTAISFNPYGNAVYVVTKAAAPSQPAQAADGEANAQGAAQGPQLIVKQRFVKTGATRGDLIAVIDGLKPGEQVVTSGLLKLRNDAAVIVDNKVQPTADTQPTPVNQ